MDRRKEQSDGDDHDSNEPGWRRRAARLRHAGDRTVAAAVDLRRPARAPASADGRPGYDHLVVWGDREHSANIAYLTGFDPRFEEAVLIVGRDRRARRSCSATSASGSPRSAPLPMRRRPVPGPQPARPAARPSQPLPEILARRGHRPRRPGRGRRLEDVREPRRRSRLPAFLVDELRTATRPAGLVENADRPADRSRRRAAGHQRGRAARRVRVGRVPDVARRAPRADRTAARDDRTRGACGCSSGTARRCRAT